MLATEATPVTRNLIVDCYAVIMAALLRGGAVAGGPASAPDFAPGFKLAAQAREFFGPAKVIRRGLGELGGHRLSLMDLTGNLATHGGQGGRAQQADRTADQDCSADLGQQGHRAARRRGAGLSRRAW
jgi:hypothetical protein